jgi:hypothetical protein
VSAVLVARAVDVARTQIGVREAPPGSNRGPEVDLYLRTVGLDPSGGCFPWCAAFVYWCFAHAAAALGARNPVVRTAGVLDHWNRAGQLGVRRLRQAPVLSRPALVRPGMVFIIRTRAGLGHTGIVEAADLGALATIEGNTNEGGSREGIGVFRRHTRSVADVNVGFIDYSSHMSGGEP